MQQYIVYMLNNLKLPLDRSKNNILFLWSGLYFQYNHIDNSWWRYKQKAINSLRQ